MGTCTITRKGYANCEQAVYVTFSDQPGVSFAINPQEFIWLATGIRVNRYDCIVSLAAGISDAGFTVIMNDQRWFTKGRKCRARRLTYWNREFGRSVVLCYYLLGRVWSLGRWDEKIVMPLKETIKPGSRLKVLESTSGYYLGRPWVTDFRLVV